MVKGKGVGFRVDANKALKFRILLTLIKPA